MHGDFEVPGYEVEGLLGASSSGEVWLGREQATGEQAALKRVRVTSTAAQEKARQVVEKIGALAHPHVLPVRDLLASEDGLVIVTDYAAGGLLEHLLFARTTLDPGEVVTTAGPIAEALAAAHARQLVHGDLNPESIHYTSEGLPLLADLGVLSFVEGGMDTGGTLGYVDPARSSEGDPAPAADVYGLAAICYAALTGNPPESEGHRPLHEVAPGVPPGLSHAVEAGLQPDPNRRPTSAQFVDLVYAACPPAPVRFPVGLLPSDSSASSSSSSSSSEGPSQGLAQGPVGGDDPFMQAIRGGGMAAASGGGGDGPESPPATRRGDADAPRSSMRRLDTGGQDAAPPRRRLPIILAIVAAVLVLAGAVGGGIYWMNRTGDGPPPEPNPTEPTPTSTEPNPTNGTGGTGGTGGAPKIEPLAVPDAPVDPKTPQDWTAVLDRLDTFRENAFRTGDIGLLKKAYTPQSPLIAPGPPCQGNQACPSDRRKLQAYIDQGARVRGKPVKIHSVRVISQTSSKAVLDVTDQLQPATAIDSTGNEFEIQGDVPRRRTITLERRDGEWLMSEIR